MSPAHGTVTLAQGRTESHRGTETTERWDLVVGADGVRSTVRDLVFGPEEDFRHDFDHVVVSAVLPRLPGALVEGDYVVLVEPGRSAHLMGMAGHDPVVFFTYRDDLPQARGTTPTTRPVEALRAVYGDFDGLMPEILDLVERAGTTHADTVGQIHLERWSRGRVVLLGDAAWCPTLYSGHGSALALAGGESLGRHLAASPRPPRRTCPPRSPRGRPSNGPAPTWRGPPPAGPGTSSCPATAWSPPCARPRCAVRLRGRRVARALRRRTPSPTGRPTRRRSPDGHRFVRAFGASDSVHCRSIGDGAADYAGPSDRRGRYVQRRPTARRSVASRARVGSSSRRPGVPVDRAAVPKGRVLPPMRPDHEPPVPASCSPGSPTRSGSRGPRVDALDPSRYRGRRVWRGDGRVHIGVPGDGAGVGCRAVARGREGARGPPGGGLGGGERRARAVVVVSLAEGRGVDAATGSADRRDHRRPDRPRRAARGARGRGRRTPAPAGGHSSTRGLAGGDGLRRRPRRPRLRRASAPCCGAPRCPWSTRPPPPSSTTSRACARPSSGRWVASAPTSCSRSPTPPRRASARVPPACSSTPRTARCRSPRPAPPTTRSPAPSRGCSGTPEQVTADRRRRR